MAAETAAAEFCGPWLGRRRGGGIYKLARLGTGVQETRHCFRALHIPVLQFLALPAVLDRAALAAAGRGAGCDICSEDRILSWPRSTVQPSTSMFSLLLSGSMLVPRACWCGVRLRTMAQSIDVFLAFTAYELLAPATARCGCLHDETGRELGSAALAGRPFEVGAGYGPPHLRLPQAGRGWSLHVQRQFSAGFRGSTLRGVDFALSRRDGRERRVNLGDRVKTRSMASAYLDSAQPDFASNLDEGTVT
jgi:hypothetical protein